MTSGIERCPQTQTHGHWLGGDGTEKRSMPGASTRCRERAGHAHQSPNLVGALRPLVLPWGAWWGAGGGSRQPRLPLLPPACLS